MNKRLLGIYVVVFILIGLMLHMYRTSYREMKVYIRDVNTVSNVVLNIEKLDALIHFWLNNDRAVQDNLDLYMPADKAYDSIESTIGYLKDLVLYQEQRLRLDTILRTVKAFQSMHERDDPALTQASREAYRGEINRIVRYSHTFAADKLDQRRMKLDESSALLDRWLVWLLVLAGVLITVATFYSFNFLHHRRRAEDFNQRLIETTNNGIMSFEPVKTDYVVTDYKVRYSNESAMKLLRIKEAKTINLSSLVPAAIYSDVRDAFDRVLEEGVSETLEGYLEKDGDKNWLQCTLAPLEDGILATIYDLNTIKKYEQRLTYEIRKLELANEELHQYAYITSHDLQEPLRKIQIFSDIGINLYDEAHGKSKDDYFRKIQKTSTRMRDLIQTLLMFTRSTDRQDEFRRVNLHQVLQQVKEDMEEMITEKGACICVKGQLPVLVGSEVHLKLLFSNLISNSLKYSKNGVPPEIEISESTLQPQDIARLPAINQYVRYSKIVYSDNGVGFKPELNEKIFTIFQRLNNKENTPGTGIGLAICRKIVHQHNGLIYAEGKENEGATFYIYLPEEQPRIEP